jgi:CubicO group peptidase (beta-lactamase class C family)
MNARSLALCLLTLASAATSVRAALNPANLQKAALYNARCDGVSMLVMEDGHVVFEDYPTTYHSDAGPNTVWGIASGTKPFNSVIAALLLHDGYITSFDEKISDTITEWQGTTKENITVRLLLQLVSGLDPNYTPNPPAVTTYAGAVNVPHINPINTVWDYGPAPFQAFGEFTRRKLLAHGIGGAAPDPIDHYLKPRVFDIIGAAYSSWGTATGSNDKILAQGSRWTARNWAPFGEFIRLGGSWNAQTIIPQATLDQVFIASSVRAVYGMAWWMETPTSPGRVTGEMVSGLGAGGQNIYISRQLKLVVVRQTSSASSSPTTAPTRLKFNSSDFFSLLLTGTLSTADTDGDLIVNTRDDFPNESGRWSDADNDGLDDLMEERILNASATDGFFNITQVIGTADFDGDGFTNAQEDIAGTDPASGSSFPAIPSITAIGSILRLQWPSAIGRRYTVQVNNTLEAAGWTNSGFSNVAGTEGTMTADIAPGAAPQFFRLSITHGITP